MAKQIHENVAPVVNWLRTAEEESDGEEEEEEVEVVYTEKASGAGLVTETVPTEDEVVRLQWFAFFETSMCDNSHGI